MPHGLVFEHGILFIRNGSMPQSLPRLGRKVRSEPARVFKINPFALSVSLNEVKSAGWYYIHALARDKTFDIVDASLCSG